MIESTIADGSDRIPDGYRCHVAATIESIIANRRDRVGNVHGSQVSATNESSIADGGDAIVLVVVINGSWDYDITRIPILTFGDFASQVFF